MLPEIGTEFESGLPDGLVFVRDLEMFDGPILAEYRRGGTFYVEKWCTRDGGTSRYLMVRTEQLALAKFLAGRITMLELLTSGDGVGFLIDRQDQLIISVRLTEIASVPQKYLPTPTRYHDVDLRPDWESIPQSYALDENWDAHQLSEIERYYTNVVGFNWFAGVEGDRSFPDGLLNFDMNGGLPVVQIFRQLRTSLPREMRPKSASVAASSPGVLTLDAPSDRVRALAQVLNALPKSGTAYDAVYGWSRLHPRESDEVPSTARDDVDRLCSFLGVASSKILKAPPGSEDEKGALLVAGKLIAAYYRMLGRVVNPKGGAEFLQQPLTGVGGFVAASISVREADDDDVEDDERDDD